MTSGREAVDLASHEKNCGANFYNSSANQISVMIVEGDCVVNIKFNNAVKMELSLNVSLEQFKS